MNRAKLLVLQVGVGIGMLVLWHVLTVYPIIGAPRQIMGNLLLDLWAANRKAVMFVTHDLEEAIALADRVVVMSAGPAARIIGDFRVALPRPRDIAEVRLEPAFHHIHKEIWSQLRVEVQKGYAQGEGAG